ncbi:MAG: hypothetical protein R2779_05060 [Crocinitomicaceae bacterium]
MQIETITNIETKDVKITREGINVAYYGDSVFRTEATPSIYGFQ